MAKRPTAREMERVAARRRPPGGAKPARLPDGEALRMLARRGLRPRLARPELAFPADLPPERLGELAVLLRHYAFRLFLRGAIQHPAGFAASEATDYLEPAKAREFAEALVRLGVASREGRGRYRLLAAARSFGGTLEWLVGRTLELELGFDVARGIKFHAPGVGGDLDVVAAAEGRLVYLELKSSPPKHLSDAEVTAFFDRVALLRPHLSLFVMDTALRLSDKVVPMLATELARRAASAPAPRRIERELWALTPSAYAVNSRPDLLRNIARAVAEGLRSLAPVPWEER